MDEATPDAIRVLCVDDDEALLDVTATMLERADDRLSVTTATEPAAALASLSDRRPDCVVSDYEMPGRDGLELLEAARDRGYDGPFVLFTGRGSEEIASEAIARGVTEYLQKGTGEEQYEVLANRVVRAAERDRTERALTAARRRRAALFANNPEPVAEYRWPDDADEPAVTDANDAFLSAFGVTSESVTGEPLAAAAVPADGTATAAELAAAEDTPVRREVRRETADGVRDFLVTLVPLEPAGTDDAGYAIYADVTPRRRRERTLETLHDAATELQAAATVRGVAEQTVAAAESILSFESCVFDVAHEGTLYPVARSTHWDDRETDPMDTDTGLAGATYRRGEAFVVDDVSSHPLTRPQTDRFRSALSVPVGDVGVFQAAAEAPAAFDDYDVELAELLVSHAAPAAAAARFDPPG